MKRRQPDSIDDEARHWVVVLSTGNNSARELADFQHWLKADVSHQVAFDQAQSVWSGLGQLDDLRGCYRVADLERFSESKLSGIRRQTKAPRMLTAIAACVAIVAVAVFWDRLYSDPQLEFETQVAQLREVDLPDGSTMTLGARSKVRVDYSDAARQVTLLSGAAFFSVEKEASRPFLVTANETTVRVLGTQFEVRHGAARVHVSVAEGVVEVIRSADWVEEPSPSPSGAERQLSDQTLLTAGQQLVAAHDGMPEEIKQISESAPGSWRVGRLYYSDTRLVDVIADVNRYYDGRVEIGSDRVGELRITGSFRTDRIEQMFANLQNILPVTVDHRDDRLVVVTGR